MKVTDETIQKIVSNVLKYGVRTVLITGIVGGTILLSKHSTEIVDYSQFKEKDESIFTVINQIFQGAVEFNGSSIVYIGILILFATQLLRLLLSLISFILEKDKLYTFITILVVIIICSSVYFGFGH